MKNFLRQEPMFKNAFDINNHKKKIYIIMFRVLK